MNDFYFGSTEWKFPMGHISFVGKLDGDTLSAGAPAIAPGWTLDLMAQALARLLAHVRGPSRSGESRDARPRWEHRPRLHAEQR